MHIKAEAVIKSAATVSLMDIKFIIVICVDILCRHNSVRSKWKVHDTADEFIVSIYIKYILWSLDV